MNNNLFTFFIVILLLIYLIKPNENYDENDYLKDIIFFGFCCLSYCFKSFDSIFCMRFYYFYLLVNIIV